jgi:putative molybdopterin biosynthesis protein
MSIPSLYTPAEVADYLHVSRGTIYSLLSRGEINSVKIGRNRRFTAENVREYLNQRAAVQVLPEVIR